METQLTDVIEILYCYAHEDEKLRDGLDIQLTSLKRMGLITTWHDRDISAGADWNSVVDRHLNEAQIVLLLVSPDFIASDYKYGVEMQRALERHRRKEARVLLVLLRPTDWQGVFPDDLLVLPKDKDGNVEPVTLWPDRDAAFLNIAASVKKIVKELAPSQKADPFQVAKERGDGFLQAGRPAGALAAYEQALAFDPNDLGVLKNKGAALLRLKRYEEARITFEKALRLDSAQADLYKSKGDALFDLERYEEALKAYDEGLQLAASSTDLLMKKGAVLISLERYQEAFIAYEQAIRIDPQNPLFYLEKARLLSSWLGKTEEAFTAYEQVIRLDPQNLLPYLEKARLLKGEFDRLIPYYATNEESEWGTTRSVINIDHNTKRYQEIVTAYKQAIRYDNKNSEPYIELGDFFFKIKNGEMEGTRAYLEAIYRDPQRVDLYLRTVASNHLPSELQISILDYLLQFHPGNASIYRMKGEALVKGKRYEEAATAYKQAIDNDPQEVDFYLQEVRGKYSPYMDPEAQVSILDHLLQFHPGNASISQMKGEALVRLERYEEAAAAYKQAIASNPPISIHSCIQSCKSIGKINDKVALDVLTYLLHIYPTNAQISPQFYGYTNAQIYGVMGDIRFETKSYSIKDIKKAAKMYRYAIHIRQSQGSSAAKMELDQWESNLRRLDEVLGIVYLKRVGGLCLLLGGSIGMFFGFSQNSGGLALVSVVMFFVGMSLALASRRIPKDTWR